jgi:hypothetical protein
MHFHLNGYYFIDIGGYLNDGAVEKLRQNSPYQME